MLTNDLYLALWQTIYMVFISSFLSINLGLSVGVILYVTRPGQMLAHPTFNKGLGAIVNITRSVPYIILMISIIPLTRILVGSSIGTNAAIVPLTLAAIPFFARVAETAICEVDPGLIEAAQSMGATPWQIICKVLIPEALPGLISGATLTIISLISYSAMAGAVGGGGLGDLAIRYGYQRFDIMVMLETVVILVVLVQLVQMLGDYSAKYRSLKGFAWLSGLLWLACFASIVMSFMATPKQDTLRVGIMSGTQEQIMQVAKQVAAKDYNLNLQLVTFDDYILPNTALNSGSIDANIFQTIPYLNAQIAERGYQISWIGKTFVYPMGLFSKKYTSLSALPFGAIVAIPNDPSNEGRALLLLQSAGLIKVDPKVGLLGTPENVTSNPRNLQFKALDVASIPRALPDVDLAAITNDYVAPAGLSLTQALFKEGPDAPYGNIIVVRTADKANPLFQKLILAMHSPQVVQATEQAYPNGAAIPAWTNS
ncbi:MAG: MetQ/NlpA family ABC transporter substrate-binding protein [Gammaproteobacteria bacterium]|nr:MetQ/NlpA family ABC transporter substrate-binding protein [Gammaproteobacteria bacterium]